MNSTIFLYDTTLRDGTQGSGITFSSEDKLRIAKRLDAFGVHFIEGGWPGANPKDEEFFARAKDMEWQHAKITAFGSTRRAGVDVEADPQIQTLLAAQTPAVTFYGKSWKLHVTEILRTTVEENRAMIRDTCAFFKAHRREVIYDAEHFFDGYKDHPDHAMQTLRAAKEGGADMVVLCDTNGGSLPFEVEEITKIVLGELGMPLGIHTHDDGGMGVVNALAAVRAGATQVQGTINGYGERNGNCNLTTVIPNLQLKMGRAVVARLEGLTDLSRFVDELANCAPNPRAPFVGEYSFAHKGGTHVNAVQKLARSYEHVQPELVGNYRNILVSEMSGQSNILLKASEMGVKLEKGTPEVKAVLRKLKDRENEGYEYEVADASFELLLRRELGTVGSYFELLEYHTTHRRSPRSAHDTCEATVKVQIGDKMIYTVEEGDGPVNALDRALRKALVSSYPEIRRLALADYKVRIIDSQSGTAAKTRVLITTTADSVTWNTVGVSGNIIDASWEALSESVSFFLMKQRAEVGGSNDVKS